MDIRGRIALAVAGAAWAALVAGCGQPGAAVDSPAGTAGPESRGMATIGAGGGERNDLAARVTGEAWTSGGAAPRACRAGQLSASLRTLAATRTADRLLLTLTNTSKAACSLADPLQLRLMAGRHEVATTYVRTPAPNTFRLCSKGTYPSYAVFPDRGNLFTTVIPPGRCSPSLTMADGHRERVEVYGLDASKAFHVGGDTYDKARGELVYTTGTTRSSGACFVGYPLNGQPKPDGAPTIYTRCGGELRTVVLRPHAAAIVGMRYDKLATPGIPEDSSVPSPVSGPRTLRLTLAGQRGYSVARWPTGVVPHGTLTFGLLVKA
jgi:hypothetical protein